MVEDINVSVPGKLSGQFGRLATALKAKRVGSSWMARCPAHDDSTPILAIRESDDGKLLLHCHAGCAQHEVIAALRQRGLWKSPVEQPLDHDRVVAHYNHTDAHGALLYQVIRYEPKRFIQRYPNKRGGWVWKKYPRQVLYRLPEVLDAPIVFFVEGEKDVETLRAYGFVATTNAGGANAPWLPQYTQALRGREVILIPDNDEPGRRRAKCIARALLGAASRLIAWWPDNAKDVTEWFASGHSEQELIEAITLEEVQR
jgi:putative DNA primase/helicase